MKFFSSFFNLVSNYVMTEALFLKTGLINANAPLKNGLGRFIPQLMRITIKFCKESPHSTGVREFIEKDIVEFAKKNPGTAIYLKPRRHRTPVVVAEYRKFELWIQPFTSLLRQNLVKNSFSTSRLGFWFQKTFFPAKGQ